MAWMLRTRLPMSRIPPVSMNCSKNRLGKKWLKISIFIGTVPLYHAARGRPRGTIEASLHGGRPFHSHRNSFVSEVGFRPRTPGHAAASRGDGQPSPGEFSDPAGARPVHVLA